MTTVSSRCSLCPGTAELAFPGLPLMRCTGCGLIWHPSPVGADLYDDTLFFGEDGYYESYFARPAQWRHEARLRLDWLQANRPSVNRLLEVGCAGGFFLEEARTRGIEVVGIEPAADGACHARDTLGLPVLQVPFETADVPGRFDVVCAFHVLEHIAEPRRFLRRAREVLTPGGAIVIEVPNIASRRAVAEGARWNNLVPDFHVWHFAPSTLTRLVQEAGFRVASVDTVFPRHYLRSRRLLTRSGARALRDDLRASRTLRRTHADAGDYLRLIATPA